MTVLQIPILNYHKIIPSFDIGITSRHPRQFEADMNQIKEAGFGTVTFRQLAQREPVPGKPVIITFDDGYESILEFAIPVLAKLGFVGVIYVPTSYIGKSNDWDVQIGKFRFRHLNRSQIQFLAKDGHEIGSHGHRHQNFCNFTDDALKFELTESKKILEELTGSAIYSVSYPFGRFNDRTLRTAREAGYSYGVSAIHFRKIDSELTDLALKRYNIYRFDSGRVLNSKIKMSFSGLLGLRDWCIQRGGSATTMLQRFKGTQKTKSG